MCVCASQYLSEPPSASRGVAWRVPGGTLSLTRRVVPVTVAIWFTAHRVDYVSAAGAAGVLDDAWGALEVREVELGPGLSVPHRVTGLVLGPPAIELESDLRACVRVCVCVCVCARVHVCVPVFERENE